MKNQFRFVFHAVAGKRLAAFIDAPTEEQARAFFAVAFPGKAIIRVSQVPTEPCAAYEKGGAS